MSSHRAAFFGWTVSLLVHGGIAAYLLWRTTTPDLGFEFELPMEVEFGLSEAVTVSAGATPPAPEPPPQEPTGAGEGSGAADAGVPADAGPSDAGRRRRRPRDAGPPAVASTEGGGSSGDGAGDQGEGRGVAFLPAGAQIALRLDVVRLRSSPLAADVRELLAAMPDWRALLEGSGIDPLDDMDRLLVASPNFDRSRLIAAGRASSEAGIRAAAERLATETGAPLEWRELEGVPVADWNDHDDTMRVVALIGPRHFVIARSEDVPRVIAVARVRAARDVPAARDVSAGRDDRTGEDGRAGVDEAGADPESEPAGEAPPEAPAVHPADALLSMEEGEGLSLEVEGFRNFARARPGRRSPLEMLPVRLRMGIRELPDGRLGVRIVGHFDTPEQAAAASEHWDRARDAYARNVITAVLGLSPVLSRLEVRSEEEVLSAHVDLEIAEMRRVLVLVRGIFEDRARAASGAPSPPITPLPSPPPSRPPSPPGVAEPEAGR